MAVGLRFIKLIPAVIKLSCAFYKFFAGIFKFFSAGKKLFIGTYRKVKAFKLGAKICDHSFHSRNAFILLNNVFKRCAVGIKFFGGGSGSGKTGFKFRKAFFIFRISGIILRPAVRNAFFGIFKVFFSLSYFFFKFFDSVIIFGNTFVIIVPAVFDFLFTVGKFDICVGKFFFRFCKFLFRIGNFGFCVVYFFIRLVFYLRKALWRSYFTDFFKIFGSDLNFRGIFIAERRKIFGSGKGKINVGVNFKNKVFLRNHYISICGTVADSGSSSVISDILRAHNDSDNFPFGSLKAVLNRVIRIGGIDRNGIAYLMDRFKLGMFFNKTFPRIFRHSSFEKNNFVHSGIRNSHKFRNNAGVAVVSYENVF